MMSCKRDRTGPSLWPRPECSEYRASGSVGHGNGAAQDRLHTTGGGVDRDSGVDLTWGAAAQGAAMVCGPEPLDAVKGGQSGEQGVVEDGMDGGRAGAQALLAMLGWANGVAQGVVPTQGAPERSKAGPQADDIGTTLHSDPAARSSSVDDIAHYEALIAEHRARLKADADAGDGNARETWQQLQAIDAAHERFAEVDLGNGMVIPAPYMVNYASAGWTERKQSDARGMAEGAARGAGVSAGDRSTMRMGKGSADANAHVLQALVNDRPWERLPVGEARLFQKKLAWVLPDGADAATRTATAVLVYAQLAGIGTDCAAYVQHMLMDMGVAPQTSVGTGVDGLTKSMGDEVEDTVHAGRGHGVVARPVDRNGAVVVRPGDMMRMRGAGHIGLVHDVVDAGDEVLLKVAHSSPDQAVHGAEGRMGTKTEGVREDFITWSRSRQRWTAVRSFKSSADLNKPGTISGFYRNNSAKTERAYKFWER